jgi:hypothetical protein
MIKQIFILLILFVVVGCSTYGPIRRIQYVEDDWLLAGRDIKNKVQIHARQYIMEDMVLGQLLTQDSWFIRAENFDDKDWCVGIDWRTMDYNIYVPNTWIFLPRKKIKNLGYAIQRIWKFDETYFSFSDAKWFINEVKLMKPINQTCKQLKNKNGESK